MNTAEFFKLQDLVCLAPALFLFIGSLLPITAKIFNNNREPNSIVSLGLALLGVIGALASAALLLADQQAAYYAFSNAMVFDGVSVLSAILIATVTGFAAIMAREHNATNGRQFAEFLFLLLNSAAGMMILAWSNDLIVTFIAIEIMSLCLYLVIALSHEEKLSKEAAFKYFVLGGFASAVFLYGVAFIYGTAGTTYIQAIIKMAPELISQNHLFSFGAVMVIIGFCFKAAIVPFHAWTPDVYEGAPTPVTAFMATGVKIVTFVALLRFVRGNFVMSDISGELINVLQWLAAITMIVGNIAAIVQNSLKRMLAYSSIAHSGYVLIGIIAASLGGEAWRGDLSVVYYVLSYSVMTLGAFGIVCLFESKENDMILIDDLSGLAKRNPTAALLFTIFMLSLAGIPPLVGFFGKFFIFSAALRQGLFWLAVWGAINSVISAYYYLRPVVLMYMKEDVGSATVSDQYHHTRGVVFLMAALVVILGLATEPLYQQVKIAITSLL
jgi:NADH-quinone oxidoreductase subunit N